MGFVKIKAELVCFTGTGFNLIAREILHFGRDDIGRGLRSYQEIQPVAGRISRQARDDNCMQKAPPKAARRSLFVLISVPDYSIHAPFASNLYSLPSMVSVSLAAITPPSFR